VAALRTEILEEARRQMSSSQETREYDNELLNEDGQDRAQQSSQDGDSEYYKCRLVWKELRGDLCSGKKADDAYK